MQCIIGEIPEWPNGADCKSVSLAFGGSNPSFPTLSDWLYYQSKKGGNSSVGRAQPFQGWGRGFESRFPLFFLR